MHILRTIVEEKNKEVELRKSLFPIPLLEKSTYFKTETVSLSKYILRNDKSGIIAEFKRRSPSVPSINLYADVEEVTIGYMQAGASALSVLTDEKFFGGTSQDLTKARMFNFCPILRKDFIIEEYQIIEARSIGADAILLIAEILDKRSVKSLAGIAKSLGMEVLMELHSAPQLDKLCDEVDIVGVNNRDLSAFTIDLQFSYSLIDQLPSDKVKVSESGIRTADEIIHLKEAGYNGFLIGELFMKEASPGMACKQFIDEVKQKSNTT